MAAQPVIVKVSYDVEAIDHQIRQTNNLLRFLNAARATVQDFKQLADDPTMAEFFWTLMQLFRTFTALRRLMRNLQGETQRLVGMRRMGMRRAPPAVGMQALADPTLVFQRMDIVQRMMEGYGLIGINIDASINNTPIPIDRIDLSNIPELTNVQLQQIMEEEGAVAVIKSKQLLRQRILHPPTTGRLESSIQMTRQLPGITIEATAPYSFWVEKGQRSFEGHHFLRDVMPEMRRRITEKIISRLNRLIRDGRVS